MSSWKSPVNLYDGSQIALAAHCIGLDNRKPYKRHERYFFRPHRNYFDCGEADMPVMLALEQRGFMTRWHSSNRWFRLTTKGAEWLEENLKVTIHKEELFHE